MTPFLRQFAKELLHRDPELKNIGVIMPGRRAAVFLKKELSLLIDKPVFAPYISTIEDFLMDMPGWEQEDNPTLVFKLYQAYSQLEITDKDNFTDFSKWAQTLLGDFNEIDRYLVNADQIYSYLADVKRLEQWHLTPGETARTGMVENYLRFWEYLPELYGNYTQDLRQEGRVYPGLVYRQVAEHLDEYLPLIRKKFKRLYFVGFSALNKAEEKIFLSLLEEGIAGFYWDVDEYYFRDEVYEAGKFLRESKLIKKLKEKGEFRWLSSGLCNSAKNISVKSVSGDTLQVIAANAVTVEYQKDELENIAVVLADETLLPSFLNNLAEPVSNLNVTMGLPLKSSPLAGFFSLLWDMHIWREGNHRKDRDGNPAFHHQKWDDLLGHSVFPRLLKEVSDNEKLRSVIRRQNRVFISFAELHAWCDGKIPVDNSNLFSDFSADPVSFCREMTALCVRLREKYEREDYQVDLLFAFFKLFQRLSELFTRYDFVKDLKVAHQFYRELLQSEVIDLQGEPLSGVQVMGMLETRALDFSTLILTSVNEDILPKGRSQNSFIPFDIKHRFGLPTYLDKDAVFAYHFYRLLQRAENITLIYNNQSNGLGGGEPSRFIAQLEYELTRANPRIAFSRQTVSGNLKLNELKETRIEKTPAVMERLRQMAKEGISPTALIDYINNPVDFYYQRVLGLQETEEVEEVIGYHTQGTIIHEMLQDYYSADEDRKRGPVREVHPDLPALKRSEQELRREVIKRLSDYGLRDADHGKNLLIRETIVSMLRNFLAREKEELNKILSQGAALGIISLEEKLVTSIVLEKGIPVNLKGIADRIDRRGEEIRVIDYKTGGVNIRDLGFKEIRELREPGKKNKAFQLMMYAYLFLMNYKSANEVKPGIISLRNVNEGLLTLKFRGREEVTFSMLEEFVELLKEILEEIFDPDIAFSEKVLTLNTDE